MAHVYLLSYLLKPEGDWISLISEGWKSFGWTWHTGTYMLINFGFLLLTIML